MRAHAAGLAVLLASCAGSDEPQAPWVAPDNDWPSHSPPAGLVGEGFGIGEVIEDLRVQDQHGDVVSTWQFYGEVVLVAISAVSCPPCRALAEDAAAVLGEYDGQPVVLVTALEEDGGGQPPERADAEEWAATYGEGSPVLADAERLFEGAAGGEYPMAMIVGRDLVVYGGVPSGSADTLRQMIDIELAR